jgi:hypothetical protein
MEPPTLTRLIEWAQRDFVVVFMCLMCLLACLYTALEVGNYEDAINRAWALQWERSGCGVRYYNVTMPFDILARYGNATAAYTNNNT